MRSHLSAAAGVAVLTLAGSKPAGADAGRADLVGSLVRVKPGRAIGWGSDVTVVLKIAKHRGPSSNNHSQPQRGERT
jgi:hypothetical protein